MYTRVSEELQGVAKLAPDRQGPNHEDLPDMLYYYLTRLPVRDRRL